MLVLRGGLRRVARRSRDRAMPWQGAEEFGVSGPGCDDDAVPTLNDLARSHTSLGEADVEYLHSLVSDWQLLADLSFADLILWAPAKDGTGWLAIAQMRPTTGPTSLPDDVVGTFAGDRKSVV